MKEFIRLYLLQTRTDEKVKNFNMEVYEGESVVLFGDASSGKEEVRDIMIGRTSAYEGNIFIHEEKVHPYQEAEARRNHQIFYINPTQMLVPTMSIAENIYTIHDNKIGILLPNRIIVTQANAILKELDSSIDATQKIQKLNFFLKLIVCIAKAISYDSKLIIMEHLTNQTSYVERVNLKKIVDKLKKQGISFLFIEEKPDGLLNLADRVVIMRNGVDKKVIQANATSIKEMLNYILGEKSEPRTRQKQLTAKGKFAILDKTNTVVTNNLYGSPLGFFDIYWNREENAFTYIYEFLKRNSMKLMIGSNEILMDLYLKKRVYKSGIAYIDENSQNEVFNEQSLETNLMIPKNRRELYSVINRKVEKFVIDDFYTKFPIFRQQKYEYSSNFMSKIISIYRWERFQPKVMILDNPMFNLDFKEVGLLQNYLRSLSNDGIAILMMCKQHGELLEVCDEIVCASNKQFKGVHSRETIEKNYKILLED
ncbi:ATP-binding cassette domain-containing protein [Lachnospiraceae bacterium ZAX-1]